MKRACAFFAEKCFAPVLFAAALAFVISCQNASDGDAPHTEPPYEVGRDAGTLTGMEYNGTSPKTLQDILNKAVFHITYSIDYSDGSRNPSTEKKSYTDLKDNLTFSIGSTEIKPDYSFPKENQTIDLKIFQIRQAVKLPAV